LQQVGAVDGGRGDVEQHLAVTWYGVRDLAQR
jgi:hypothetical protein